MAWMRRVRRRRTFSLARRLGSYPAYHAPFAGPPRALTLAQATANFDDVLRRRQDRLAVLRDLLNDFNVPVPETLETCDLTALLASVNGWAVAEWPGIYDPAIATREHWLASSRNGVQIVYSLLLDVGLLFGELVVQRRGEYSWALDLDPVNDVDGIDSFKRPVVQIPKGGPFPAPIIFDFEATAAHMYINPDNPTYRATPELTRGVRDAISGAHERHWLEQHSDV